MIVPILTLIGSLIILYFSSDWVTKSSVKLSRVIGVSTTVIGFFFLSIATSLPEFLVTIISISSQEINLPLGNIVGSNFMDITFILGLMILLGKSIQIEKREFRGYINILFFQLLITLVLFMFGILSVFHGIALLVLYFAFNRGFYKRGRVEKIVKEKGGDHGLKVVGFFLLSLCLLLVASYYLVQSSIEIAGMLGLTTTFIGATIVAIGTSFPELSVGIRALKSSEYGLAMGEILGSTIANITLIMGTLLVGYGFLHGFAEISMESVFSLITFLCIATIFIWYRIDNNDKISKRDGMILLFLAILFMLKEGLVAFI